MAKQGRSDSPLPFPIRQALAHILCLAILVLTITLPICAQTPPPQRVYASPPTPGVPPSPTSLIGFSKDGATGVLTLIPGSPFNERLEGGPVAVDGQGKFLFVLNPTSNDISMFQIDPASGALSEVPGSPFGVPSPSPQPPPVGPMSLATERAGKFLFVGFRHASGPNEQLSAVASLAIDTSGANPVLNLIELNFPSLPAGNGTPVQLLTDSKGLHLYVGMSSGTTVGGAAVYSITPTGHLISQGSADLLLSAGFLYAIDPKDRFFYASGLGGLKYLESCVISPVDGTAMNCQPFFQLAFGDSATGMAAENSGQFLYVTQNGGVVVYSVDQTTGAIAPVLGPLGIVQAQWLVADPMGPYLYSYTVNASSPSIRAFKIDTATGNLTEISGSPFDPGAPCCNGFVVTGNLSPPINGPGAAIFPSSASAFSTTAGTTSAVQVFSIVNNGTQSLTINSISIVGTNPTSFSQSNTCGASLSPDANCSVSITFNPTSAGTFTASLQVADNAAGSPQTLALSGTGVAPLPSVSLSPGSLTFNQIAEGVTEGPQTVTVTNTGTGPLHVSAVALGGPNPNDFSQANTCVGTPVAVSATCTVSVSFTPIAPGVRTATLTLKDDAQDATQNVSLQGTGTAPFQMTPTSVSSTSATVTAGQTAQYSLQLNPGTGFTGTVSLACTGAPTAARCSVSPASLNITNANAANFSVSISTTGNASAPMFVRNTPFLDWRLYPVIAAWLVFLLLIRVNETKSVVRKLSACAASCVFVILLFASGCGGGSTTPAPLVTPKGNYTITVSATANNLPAQTISLTLTVN